MTADEIRKLLRDAESGDNRMALVMAVPEAIRLLLDENAALRELVERVVLVQGGVCEAQGCNFLAPPSGTPRIDITEWLAAARACLGGKP